MFVVFTRVDSKPGARASAASWSNRHTKGFAVTGTYHTMGGENLHEVQFNDFELPLENLVIEGTAFRSCSTAFNTQRCLNPSISPRPGRGRDRRSGQLRARASTLRPADRRLPGHALESSPTCTTISRPAAACSIAPAPAATSSPTRSLAAHGQDLLQRDVHPRDQRGDPGARRLRLHRRISGLAAFTAARATARSAEAPPRRYAT